MNIFSLLGENRISMFNLLNIRNSKRGFSDSENRLPSPRFSDVQTSFSHRKTTPLHIELIKEREIKSAFTLAEVLITLVIIGIIAAITVPSLINKTNNQETVSKLKKAYSTLAQATNQIIMQEGPVTGWATSVDNLYNLYKKKLITAKDCDTNTGCFEQGRVYYLNGEYIDGWNTSSYDKRMVLQDGTQILFSHYYTSDNCNFNKDDAGIGSNNVCARIVIDINGAKKPNTIGKDIFNFVLKKNGLYPAGCDENNYCDKNKSGWACACKVLREGAINY